MGTVEIDDRGRITIPKELRNRLQLDPGDELAVELTDGEIRLGRTEGGLQTVSTDGEWEEAFYDAGEATFGDG